MKHKYLFSTAIIAMMFVSPLFADGVEDLQTKKITQVRMTLFPVPADSSNYFFMQIIENETVIIIGDFSGVDKKIIMITDKNNDNTIDSVFEYFPLTKDLKKKTESKSKFFTKDIAKLKKDIITGTIFKGNYSDEMKSLNTLDAILSDPDSNTLYADVYGFNAKYFEVDERKKSSARFSYGKTSEGYYLQFRTEYIRKDFKTKQIPILNYSVYCKDTNDPVVKETVENLFKVKKPGANSENGLK